MGDLTPNTAAVASLLKAPCPITDGHDVGQFASGKPVLDDWLRRRALASEAHSARTYVVTHGNRVVGYYCLAAGSIQQADLPRRAKPHGTPLQVPVIIIGRLAVDKSFQGRRIGPGLLKDAILRSLGVADSIGVQAILAHALDDEAARFYAKYKFIKCPPVDHRTFILPIWTAREALP